MRQQRVRCTQLGNGISSGRGSRERKKKAQMTTIESDTAREFHGRTRHGVLSSKCALRNQVSLALWIRNGQGHVPTDNYNSH